MQPVTYEELKQIDQENGQIVGWDFSRINTGRCPVPWDYLQVVRSYLKPDDFVLDIGTGGGEIYLSLAPYFGIGIAIDDCPSMLATAKNNQSTSAMDHIEFVQMDACNLGFKQDLFDVVLLRHLSVYVSEILRVLRPGGYFITQMVGKNSSKNFLEAFGWTPASFGPDWWQPVAELADQFKAQGCHILAQGEYDVPTWFKDMASFMFWMMAVPWPEEIQLDKHWQNINRILETSTTQWGIETNEHRGLLIVQKK
jgi:SAM-dependent methyltransferase